jgi:CAAX protease family protein
MLRSMDARTFFFDDKGHLRSAWRLCLFVVAFYICSALSLILLLGGAGLVLRRPVAELANSHWVFVFGHGSILISAALVGWGCGRLFEGLPFRALGCSLQPGWLKDLGIGSALGAASLMLAALLATATRGVHFSIDPVSAGSIGKTLVVSALVFVFAAAAEEVLFRGYPLQTLTRANLPWPGVVLTSLVFASAHLANPNIVPRLTFLNTALAGVLLAVGYLRTGGLWFAIGWHWSWNWMQGAVVGLPVSGINRIAPAPLLQAMNSGPDWLTGGAYGIEGGAACTIALLISTLVIWRWKLIARANVSLG